MRDSVISRAERHLDAAGRPASTVHAEVAELVASRAHLTSGYRDEVTARDRFITDMAQRSRERSLSRDDGLEL